MAQCTKGRWRRAADPVSDEASLHILRVGRRDVARVRTTFGGSTAYVDSGQHGLVPVGMRHASTVTGKLSRYPHPMIYSRVRDAKKLAADMWCSRGKFTTTTRDGEGMVLIPHADAQAERKLAARQAGGKPKKKKPRRKLDAEARAETRLAAKVVAGDASMRRQGWKFHPETGRPLQGVRGKKKSCKFGLRSDGKCRKTPCKFGERKDGKCRKTRKPRR